MTRETRFPETSGLKPDRFAAYAWGVMAFNLAVIVWGAYVRASKSGAGCGSHWPLCNGEVIPQSPAVKTLVELAHRMTSGLALVLVVVLFVWAFRAYKKGHPVRTGAALSLVFIVTEALIGAGLVLFQLVADNASIARAIYLSLHLINTFVLLAALALTAWWADRSETVRWRGQGAIRWALVAALVAALVLGVSGAVAALGDTLFPSGSLSEGLRQDFSPTAHLLIRLRLLHPVLAAAVGTYLLFVSATAARLRPGACVKRWAGAVVALVFVQLGVGMLNVALLAPIWLQLVHLLLADLLWVALVLLTASTLAPAESKAESFEQVNLRPAVGL
jgi:heme A synthase